MPGCLPRPHISGRSPCRSLFPCPLPATDHLILAAFAPVPSFLVHLKFYDRLDVPLMNATGVVRDHFFVPLLALSSVLLASPDFLNRVISLFLFFFL